MAIGDNLGVWIHRSYLSVPDRLGRIGFDPTKLDEPGLAPRLTEFGKEAVKLIWAEGVADLSKTSGDQLRGTLRFTKEFGLDLTGTVEFDADGNPASLQIDARVVPGSETPTYQLRGLFTGPWADGQDEVPTVVGSILYRGGLPADKEHPGTVGSFILVKTEKPADEILNGRS